MLSTWKLIQEDKTRFVQDIMMLMPLARTPMDKKGGKSLEKYAKKVGRALEKRMPWLRTRRGKLAHLRDKVPSGETRILLAPGEPDPSGNPLFKGVKTIRE